MIHKSMTNWEVKGPKVSDWFKEYAVGNCAEPLALSMVLKMKRDNGVYCGKRRATDESLDQVFEVYNPRIKLR
jgi:hypothetical protein